MTGAIRTSAALLCLCLGCRDAVHAVPSSASAPAQLDFGAVQVGESRTLPLTITNDSLSALDLTGADLPAPYTLTGAPAAIASSGTATVQVTFAPAAPQAYDATLTLQLNATDTPSLPVRLTGSGTAPVSQVPDAGPAGCSAATCGGTQACCGDVCVDTQSDPSHCGGCGACASGQSCVSGSCVSPAPTTCDDVTSPCPGAQKCCNHACTDVGPSGLCPCTAPGGGTTFDPGTIIIPMDACYQRGVDIATLPSYCNTANSSASGSDAPLKAYGLVFFLLRHQVTVYMGINPNKTSIDAVDLSIGSFVLRTTPVQRYDWASGKAVSLPDTTTTSVQYRGAPFIIDSSEHDRVLQLLATDPDFAQFRTAANVTVHIAGKSFQTAIAKSITAVPSRIALLYATAGSEVTTDILVRYLASAGLDFAGAGGTPASHGQIYDVLHESDFLPDYDHSNLKAGGYKLLWAPHWEGGTSNTPAQLQAIGDFVGAGGDLFAECAAIGTLEGLVGGQPGSSATRFMTSSGMDGNALNFGNSYGGPFTFNGLTSPFAQRGDFPFAGFNGAITDFFPALGSGYYSGVVRYVTASDDFGNATDLFTSIDQRDAGKGTVVYLAGHDYSPSGDYSGTVGVTAGSRLVLNTLFALGQNNICQP